jgi:hypothetical protein
MSKLPQRHRQNRSGITVVNYPQYTSLARSSTAYRQAEESDNRFARISAGYGAGIRIKFNKFSKTNVAFDYAFGTDGSKGLFLNLGEVF